MSAGHTFRRPQSVVALPDPGLEVRIEAKPAERTSLAGFLEVSGVHTLRGVLVLQRWRGQGVRVTGFVEASLTQSCVVTLEPVKTSLKVDVDRKFLPETLLEKDADPHEMLIDPEGEDPPDPLPQSLDLGELAAEEIALNLDPYPRKPGADAAEETNAPPEAESPLAALKSILKS